MARPAKILSKDDILRAQSKTLSNFAAARYLHISYNHYKKYARLYKDEETGLSLLEKHKNQAGKGIPKYLKGTGEDAPLLDLVEGRVAPEHFNPKKIKGRIIAEGLLREECNNCGFSERRIADSKIPLILNHRDGDKQNFLLENLEFLCYNCAFLYAESPITDEQVERMEDYVDRNTPEFNWELDEHHLEHLASLGLRPGKDDEDTKPGSQYISRE